MVQCRIEEDVRGEELPETPETAEEEPVKQRKNGLYPGVSDELAESMRAAGPTPSCTICGRSRRPRRPPPAAPRSPPVSRVSVWSSPRAT
ncbi:hypothetical protein GCM10023238_34340 [Streptomyces heliomycini]